MEGQWLEGSGSKNKASHDPPEAMLQTAGILLSLKHSSLPTRSSQEGCMNVKGFPYSLTDSLNQFNSEKSPKPPFDLLSYTGGIFNNVLRVNSPDRVTTAIGFTGLNCFIPQFGDLANGYYPPSPIPILKTNHMLPQMASDDSSFSVSGNSSTSTIISSYPLHNPEGSFVGNDASVNARETCSSFADRPIDIECEEQLLGNQNASDITNLTSTEAETIKGNKCYVCGKVYARPSTLKTHLRTHTGEKPFKCSICFKSFAQDANLTAHLRIHSGEKPFQCAVCDRRFAQSSSVTTHMRIHSGERPYKCKVCSRGFADSSTLTKHLRIHTGEKPYECKVCEMRFSQSGNLSRHMRVHKKTLYDELM